MKMSGGPKQFGVDAERVPKMLERIGKLGLDFQGFHIFSGSQNCAPKRSRKRRKKPSACVELARHAPSPVRLLNIGGGSASPTSR